MASKGKQSKSRERGRKAGASAPPTPRSRLRWPKAMLARLKAAGIKTEPRGK